VSYCGLLPYTTVAGVQDLTRFMRGSGAAGASWWGRLLTAAARPLGVPSEGYDNVDMALTWLIEARRRRILRC
jgi:hypothetical protein